MRFFLRSARYLGIMIILVFSISEVVMRLLGYLPHQPVYTDIVSSPPDAIIYDSNYGLGLNPGTYDITINRGLRYHATHLPDSTRLTSHNAQNGKPEIFILGCSFAYGMGVDDEKTFASLIQGDFPEMNVRNLAAPAYSTVHSYLQLKSQLERGHIPAVVVLAYTSYQDARNQLSGLQQKYWRESLIRGNHPGLEDARMPYVVKKDTGLEIRYLPLTDFSAWWKLSRYSAVVDGLEHIWSNFMYGFTDKYTLTEEVIGKIKNLCEQHQIRLVIMPLDKSQSAEKLKTFCLNQGIDFLDACIDIQDPYYNLEPYDSHPNEAAHLFYAERLKGYLEQHIDKIQCGPVY
ncbi:MAG: hypothetical protein KDC34_17210 [Saprospiraceae bacterium]|nr:hypothetical protein [Saprospiraceae bacterium]